MIAGKLSLNANEEQVGSARNYQIKVTLLSTTPPIWRLLVVPADMTLEQLHRVLQEAIGWEVATCMTSA